MVSLPTLLHLGWKTTPRILPEVFPRPDLGKDTWEVRFGGASGFVTGGQLRVEYDGTISVLSNHTKVGTVELDVGD